MNAKHAKQTVREWVEATIDQWPGLRAAHLVGGITTMPDDAPFPSHKDVDLHLIFDDGSHALQPTNPFMNIVEVSYGGLSIEAGLKPVTDYRSAEAVLANPEIAYHLTVDSLLYDPSGLLRDLQERIKPEYRRQRWALARIEHERNGLAGMLAMRPMATATYGAPSEVNLLGYSTTFLTAALWVATLSPPKMGSRMFLRLREVLAAHDRLDLHEEVLALLGMQSLCPERVEQLVREGAEAFDLAVEIRQTPTPFDHKLHRHLRPYFVDSCLSMVREGFHREACGWALPYLLATTAVILADGPEAVKPRFAARQAAFLRDLGLDTPEALAARFEQATRLYDQIFMLAHEIVANHPDVVD